MVPKLKIHFWNISGYINIDFKTKKLILEKISQKYSLNRFSKKLRISDVSIGHFLRNKESFMRINNLLDILKCLKISKEDMEKNIIGYKDTSSKKPFSIEFPYLLSPLHMRVGGVLIGDGNIHKTTNLTRWIQKDPTPMKKLIEFILGKSIYFKKGSFQIVIPAFFSKSLCYSLNLEPYYLATEEFIKKCLNLPKDYGLALLIALIEDEGNIDVKNYGGINIRMASKKIVFAIKNLCNYLGYKTSEIVCYKNNCTFNTNNEKKLMYKIKINAEGMRRLGVDILSLEKKFGKRISLWKKRDSFFKRWRKCIGERAMKNLEGKNIRNKINNLFMKHKTLSPLEISKILEIDYDRIYNLMKNMRKRGEIKRIDKGIYTEN